MSILNQIILLSFLGKQQLAVNMNIKILAGHVFFSFNKIQTNEMNS